MLGMDLLNCPRLFSILLPSSSFGSEEKSIWLRCVSESNVDRVGKAWKVWYVVFSGTLKKFLYYASPYSKKKGPVPSDWNVLLHSSDLNLSFNRPCIQRSVSYSAQTSAYSTRKVSSFLLIEYRGNTTRFLDSDPCVLNLLFLDI